ncbi:MAG: aryl-sulfate sulfotransferase [Planctomycetota bacterium]
MILLLLLVVVGRARASHPVFQSVPQVEKNPNPRVPLAAIVTFTPSEPVTTRLVVTEGDRKWVLEYPPERDPADGLPVIGMKYGREHRISVTVTNQAGESSTSKTVLVFATPKKPTDPTLIPPVRVLVSDPDRMEPGYTLASIRRNLPLRDRRDRARAGASFGLLAAFDHQGEIVWSYYGDARISDVEPLSNGNILFLTTDFTAVEIDLVGNTVAEWYAADRPAGEGRGVGIPSLTMHHEIDELPNGNLLVMGTEMRAFDDWYTSESDPDAPRSRQNVMGDVIIEFTREGEVVWEWKALDHLDPYRIGYETFTQYWIRRGFDGARDWSHGNGFVYDPTDDSLLISFRMQDAVVKVDRKSGDVVWILGDHAGWKQSLQQKLLTPIGEMNWFYHQHMPQLTEEGTLVLFDNRTWSAIPFAKPLPPAMTWTRAIELKVDEANQTVEKLWASEDYAIDRLMTFAMGEADVMKKTGNVLVFYGSAAVVTDTTLRWDDVLGNRSVVNRGTRVREFTRTRPAECIFDIELRDESEDNQIRWGIYGGARVSLGAVPLP